MFNIDESTVERDHVQVPSSNRLTLNHHRSTSQCPATSLRLPPPPPPPTTTTQSNNYSLPQNNSSGSEMNFLCDQKSSSSTSVSSSLGGGGTTDNSNGYESSVPQRSTQVRSSGVPPQQHFINSHHSHPYVAMQDANSVLFTSTPPTAPQPPTAMASAAATQQQTPPGFMMEHQYQQPQHQHKSNVHHLQQIIKGSSITNTTTSTSTPIQRHMPRQSVPSGGSGSDAHPGVIHATNADVMCRQPSGSLNATSSNTSYNHTDSSKTSSVSSQSSSAIGDNEEDWESGESSAKQLDHITLLLSTSFVTTSPVPPIQLPTHNNNTSTNLSLIKDRSRSDQKINTGIQQSSSYTSASTCTSSTSTSTSSTSTSTSSSTFFFTSKCPNNRSNTSSSSCINRVVGGDDDDDDNCDNMVHNVDNDNKCKQKTLKASSKIVVNQNEPPSNMTQQTENNSNSSISKTVESNQEGNVSQNKTDLVPSSTRPKLMHLLMAPKNNNNNSNNKNNNGSAHQTTHKPIFKRKSSYKLMKTLSNTAAGYSTSSDATQASSADPNNCDNSLVDPVVGSFGGVAPTSKQKLKIKLKKNKLKLSQKFQWFQSYFRSDPVDFCENFVQQTTSMRRNSICSMASRTHKLSTTTPPSITPPPPPLAEATEGSSSSEQLNDRAAASVSQSTSNASIATGDLCEDYYSYMCDNQLSFSNSPCKSPRSMGDIASSINGGGGGGSSVLTGGSFGSSFVRSADGHYRERRETMPGARRNNVVIVAAKPAKTNAIGFNVKSLGALNFDQKPPLARHDSIDIDTSPASIYYTPESGSQPSKDDVSNENTGFVFPQTAAKLHTDNSGGKISTGKPQPKYSLNLVIVKECPFESSPKSTCNDFDDRHSGICSFDQEQRDLVAQEHIVAKSSTEDDSSHLTGTALSLATGVDEFLERKNAITTCASVCSNSSSSGFGTSECCTTNSSSSSCNCNPFAVVLERHATLATMTKEQQQQHEQKQQHQQESIRDVIEVRTIANAIMDSDASSLNSVESKEDVSLKTVSKAKNDTKRD